MRHTDAATGLRAVVLDSDLGDPQLERAVLAAANVELAAGSARSDDEIVELAADAQGVFVQYARLSPDVLARLPRLRAIVCYGVGTDNVDAAAAAGAGVRVLGVRDYCVDEVADHTLALVLTVLRDVCGLAAEVRAGRWPRTRDLGPMRALAGLRYAVVGYGSIGRAVLRRVAAFGAEAVAYDPAVPEGRMRDDGVRAVALDDAFDSDVLSLHAPLSPDTEGLVNARRLAAMRPGAVLVNVARGGLVNERALLAALDDGPLAAAALDVLDSEPPAAGDPLVAHPRVLVTPHAAWYSPPAVERLRTRAAEAMVTAIRG